MGPLWSRSHLELRQWEGQTSGAECEEAGAGSPQQVPWPRLTGSHILEAVFKRETVTGTKPMQGQGSSLLTPSHTCGLGQQAHLIRPIVPG